MDTDSVTEKFRRFHRHVSWGCSIGLYRLLRFSLRRLPSMSRHEFKRKTGLVPIRNGNTWSVSIPDHGAVIERSSYNETFAILSLYQEFWKIRSRQCIERDGKCRMCQSTRCLDADHIKARSSGGTDELENLRTLCRSCHHKRHFGGGISCP